MVSRTDLISRRVHAATLSYHCSSFSFAVFLVSFRPEYRHSSSGEAVLPACACLSGTLVVGWMAEMEGVVGALQELLLKIKFSQVRSEEHTSELQSPDHLV